MESCRKSSYKLEELYSLRQDDHAALLERQSDRGWFHANPGFEQSSVAPTYWHHSAATGSIGALGSAEGSYHYRFARSSGPPDGSSGFLSQTVRVIGPGRFAARASMVRNLDADRGTVVLGVSARGLLYKGGSPSDSCWPEKPLGPATPEKVVRRTVAAVPSPDEVPWMLFETGEIDLSDCGINQFYSCGAVIRTWARNKLYRPGDPDVAPLVRIDSFGAHAR